jgi:uncharacterized protein YbjQ (UPF0145 family)
LPRQVSLPGEASFERLVAAESSDIRARAVLDEWLRLGIVELDAHDNVRLISDAFVPKKGFEEKAYFFGRNLRDHIAASTHNLLGQEPPFLERSVYYGRLSPAAVSELASMAEQLGMEALLTINRRARDLRAHTSTDLDSARTHAPQRMTFGVYFFSEAEQEPSEPTSDKERPHADLP